MLKEVSKKVFFRYCSVIKRQADTGSSNLLKLTEDKAARAEEMVIDFWLLSLFPNYTSETSLL